MNLKFFTGVAVTLLLAPMLPAQSLNVLHTFATAQLKADGAAPEAGLALSGNTLYGTTDGGGTNDFGVVFSINTDGTGFAVLHTFSAVDSATNTVNADGARPQGDLLLVGDTLFGTTTIGGTNGGGVVFSINTNGMSFAVIHNFDSNNVLGIANNAGGSFPAAGLVVSGNILYGATEEGGTNGIGTVFSLNTNGTGFTVIYTFKTPKNYAGANSDGANPHADLVLSGNILYGTAPAGGANGYGTVFAVNTSSSSLSLLHTFTTDPDGTNLDGVYPRGGLVLSGNMLYGTANAGGTNAEGLLFSINVNNNAFSVIHTFPPTPNTDGADPEGTLALAGHTLYGMANLGGANRTGTVFSLNTNGAGFNVLYAFTKFMAGTNLDGGRPETGLILSGATLYGTSFFGGANGSGTVFGLGIQPVINRLNLVGTSVVLDAANGVAGESCSVLMSTNLALPLPQWLPLSTNVLDNGGSFTITATNAVSPASGLQFYTLQAH